MYPASHTHTHREKSISLITKIFMQDLKLYSSAAENSSLLGKDAVSFGEWSKYNKGLYYSST
jgi:hypothetical protein